MNRITAVCLYSNVSLIRPGEKYEFDKIYTGLRYTTYLIEVAKYIAVRPLASLALIIEGLDEIIAVFEIIDVPSNS